MQRYLQAAVELYWTHVLLFLMRMKMGLGSLGPHLGFGWLGAPSALESLLLWESGQEKCLLGRSRT